jgi:PAS domain S-box-containing protein
MGEEIEPVAYKRAFRETPNPAIIAGRDYVIRDVNQALLDFTGYDREEIIGQTPDFLISDPELFFGEVAPALYEEEPWIGSFELKAKDDRFRYGYGTATPLYEGDDVIGYVGVFVDITKRRRAEQTTRILNRVLRHNLRNDANVILGHLDLLREKVDSDGDGEESISIVEKRLTRLLGRADTARDLEDLLSTDAATDVGPTRIDEMLLEQVEAMRERYPNARFSVDCIPETYVAANSALAKGFEAVLENAVEHNDADTPEVEVSMHTDERNVDVVVADNGPGIVEAELDLVLGLEELDQVRHGQGIDLFFVSELMAEYSGRISVESNDPRGTVFSFHLRRQSPP